MRFILLLIFSFQVIYAQKELETKDEIIFFSLNHTFQIPEGDLKKRFGNNSNINAMIAYKFNNDFLFSIEGGAIFGANIKENNLFDNMDGNNGNLISPNGEIPTIRLFQRGAHLDFNFGKFFKILNRNSESGILMTMGVGYLYHKILIETLTIELPQLSGELLKGYDRLSGGILTKQFIGYLHFSKKNNIRYLLGLEFMQSITKDLRQYNYSLQSKLDEKRKDYLLGFKCGFIIPIRKRKSERYYYY